MLSKSQARSFFLAGTGLCSVAFIGLTVDTFTRIPTQTNAEAITAEVVRGKDLWDHNNCMGCHTLFGEGAYYAPELTKVYERRGETFIRAMLKDPASMYPGQRQMRKYDFTPEQIDSLVAFFKWTGSVDLNGFPAKPVLAPPTTPPSAEPSGALAGNRPATFNQICVACHSLDGRGGNVGPVLDHVATRLDADYMRRWIKDPGAVKPGSKMPNLSLTDGQVDELVTFLQTKK